jgi:conjugal transfer ATP-binding protein TraC
VSVVLPDKSFNADRLSQLFDVISYDKDTKLFWCDDRALGFGFECAPLLGADESVQSRINTLLSSEWPVGTMLQFVLFSTDNITDALRSYERLRADQSDELLKTLVRSRVRFLEERAQRVEAGHAPVRNIRLIVTVKMPITGEEPSHADFEKATDVRVLVTKSLDSIGLHPVPLTATTYLRAMREILMKGKTASWQGPFVGEAEDDKPLCEQILDWDKAVTVDAKGVWSGETRIKTLSVKRFPRVAYPGYGMHFLGDLMTGARGLRSHFMISFTVFLPDPQAMKAKMDAKRQFTVSQAVGPLVKFAPIIAQKRESFDVLNDALDAGDRLGRVYLGLTVFGRSEEEAEEAAATARSYFSEYGIQLIADRYFVLPLFLNGVPFGADRKQINALFRYKTMASSQYSNFLPIYADWKGTGSAVQNMISRNGQLQSVDMFDSTTNFNSVVAASSGSGKSYFIASMIMSYYTMGGQIWVIDVGRSYLKLCELVGGDFIHFGPDTDVCLNPFELVENYQEESDLLVGLVIAMAAPTQPLTDLQIANLRRIMSEQWEQHGKGLTIDHIEQQCLISEDRRIRDVGEQLFSFTSRGEYGRFFNGRNNVDFKNRLTVLELDDLQGREHLQQVVLLQLIFQIQQAAYFGDIEQRKLCIVDESWSLLSKGEVGHFIEHGFRRFRKVGTSATVISQGIEDFHSSGVGRAIVENSANMYLLRQKGDSITRLKKESKLPLTEGEFELLKTVHTVPGSYSEIYFVTEYGRGIGRLMVDPFQNLLFSTKAEDTQAVRRYRDQGMSVDHAIEAVLRDRGLMA